MEKLLDDLFQRWESAFDKLYLTSRYREQAETILYADGSRYDLEKFDWTLFPTGGPMMEDRSELKQGTLYEYGLNAEGLPCYLKFGHEYNQVAWEGFYIYNDDDVEYLEFCVNTGIPSVFKRMVFQNGKKIMFQSLAVNSGGGAPIYFNLSKNDIVRDLRNDESSFFVVVKRFEYKCDRIDTSSSINIIPGLGKYTSRDEYTYSETGVLDKIRTFFEDGKSQLSYCRNKQDLDLATLIDKLAFAMAGAIVEVLIHQDIQTPIALLDLHYHLGDNYRPLLLWQSAEDIEEKMQRGDFPFINDKYDGPNVDVTPFEDLFVLLEQMMDENDDMDAGRAMLRKACAILTESKLSGKIEVTEDFAAYAIDWSIEGHSDEDFEDILSECGVKQEIIAQWRQKGMLPLSEE